MLVWLLSHGEGLPVQEGSRTMRAGMLALALRARGHEVVWWASTLLHQCKRLYANEDTTVRIDPRFSLRLLHSGAYRQNLSLRRYLHHKSLGHRFRDVAPSADPPDVVVAAFPVIDLAYEATRYARSRGIPIVLDVRDLWPDAIVERLAGPLRPFGRRMLSGDFSRARYCLRQTDGIVAVSRGCLEWALGYAGRPERPTDRVFYIGYPASANANSSNPSKRLAWLTRRLSDDVICAFVGMFGHLYELELVCDAAGMLTGAPGIPVHFVLAGDGPKMAAIARRVNSRLPITLTGWLSSEEIQQMLQFAAIGLLPCRDFRDAMPNKVFEYLAAGIPVISSAEGELATLLASEEAGLSYLPGDARTLAAHVRTLASDAGLRRGMAANARRLFNTRFRGDAIYDQYAEYLEHIALRQHSKVRMTVMSAAPDTPAAST